MVNERAIGELERDLRESNQWANHETNQEIEGIIARAEQFVKGSETEGLAPWAYGALSRIENTYPSSLPYGGPYSALNSLQQRLPIFRRAMRRVFERGGTEELELLRQTADEIKRDYDRFKEGRELMQDKLRVLRRDQP